MLVLSRLPLIERSSLSPSIPLTWCEHCDNAQAMIVRISPVMPNIVSELSAIYQYHSIQHALVQDLLRLNLEKNAILRRRNVNTFAGLTNLWICLMLASMFPIL